MATGTAAVETETDFDGINRRTYARSDVVHHYGSREGSVDRGEQLAFDALEARLASGTLLDIGIGGGRTIPLLLPRARHYVGIDYVKENVDAAAACHPSADLRTLDARDLPWDDGSIDGVVFSFNGIDSVGFDARQRILQEIYRVLRPGGPFVFSCLNLDGPSARARIELPLRTRDGLLPLLKDVARLPFWAFRCLRSGIPVYLQARSLRTDVPAGFALIQAPIHDFGLLLMFSTVPAMAEQLSRIGFDLEQVHGEDGLRLDPREPARSSRWCYFIARKP